MNDIGHERKCAVCKRKFIIYPDWVYKRGDHEHCKVFCSWKCLREFDAGHGDSREMKNKIIQALKDGLTVREISVLLGVDYSRVNYWKEKLRKEQENDEGTGEADS